MIVTSKFTCTHQWGTTRRKWLQQCGAAAVTQHCRKLTISPRIYQRYTSLAISPRFDTRFTSNCRITPHYKITMLICGLAKYSVYHVIQHAIRCSPVLQQSTIIVTPKITCTHKWVTTRLMWWRQCGAVAVTQPCGKLTIGPRLDERYTSNLQTPPALQYRNIDMRIHNMLSALRDTTWHMPQPLFDHKVQSS